MAWPVIRLLRASTSGLFALFGFNPPTHTERVHAPEELLQLLSESREHGLVERSDAAMIAGVLDLSNTSVREAMTPRTEICAVEHQWPLEKIIDVVQHEGYSRLPVYDGDLDHIVGILLVKDLLAFFDRTTPFSADKVMREPFFTTPTMLVDDLMEELQQHNAHMSIVVDEYGGTLGLITLEDLIEGIVGDIFDEFDQADDARVEATAEGHLSVPGDMPIQDLNERYDLHLSAGDYVTVAGLVLSSLGHIPNVGQVTTIDGVAFHVTAMDRQRIERLEIILPNTAESPLSSG
jgi:CBS domain containing-hemolysin-like protein